MESHLRARFYNPVVGRFVSEDIYKGDGFNLYAYWGNNPVGYYDPSGYADRKVTYTDRDIILWENCREKLTTWNK